MRKMNGGPITKDNFVEGNEALTKLQEALKVQHGEATFNESMSIARREREMIDSIVLVRRHKKLTQKALAKEMKTKAQQISKYERSEQVPTLSALLKMCDALDLELSLKPKGEDKVIFHS